MVQSNSIYKSNAIQLVTWPLIVVMLLAMNSCNITYTGKINQKKIEKYFGQNNLNGTININELSKLLHEKSKDTSNLMFIDSILTFQNIAFLFDSTGYVKDLLGSNYFKKNLESISLAIGYYNFDRPITIPTAQNRLPQKLSLHFNDLSSIVNIQYSKEIKDSNNILVFIAPNQTNRAYLKIMKSFRVNWKKLFERDNFILLFIKE